MSLKKITLRLDEKDIQSQSSPSRRISNKKLRSILATYDDFYTALYHDRLNPQPQNEQQLLSRKEDNQ